MNLNISTQINFLRSEDPKCVPALLPYLKMYGNRCMSHSTLQPGLHHALLEPAGYVSWLEINPLHMEKHAVILSEPVSSAELMLIKKIAAHLGQITLVQIGEDLARTLFNEGYSVYQIGVESELDIQNYSLDGKYKSSLRQWRNKALRSGLTVEEAPLSCADRQEVEGLCQDWLKNRGGKELSFLTRPLPAGDEEGVRFFWVRREDELLGFTGFDPIYSNCDIIGYYHNFDRLSSSAVNGTSAFTLLQAMDKFRNEGRKVLNLGLSPLLDIEKGYSMTGALQRLTHLFYAYGEKVYPFKGNAGHKSKFRGNKKKVFVASNAMWFKTMIAAATACGLEL